MAPLMQRQQQRADVDLLARSARSRRPPRPAAAALPPAARAASEPGRRPPGPTPRAPPACAGAWPAWRRRAQGEECAEPPWPLASQPSKACCCRWAPDTETKIPTEPAPGGCLLAPGMNCLTHRAAPPMLLRGPPGQRQCPRRALPCATGGGPAGTSPFTGAPVCAVCSLCRNSCSSSAISRPAMTSMRASPLWPALDLTDSIRWSTSRPIAARCCSSPSRQPMRVGIAVDPQRHLRHATSPFPTRVSPACRRRR